MTMDRQKTKEEVIEALHGVASEMHDKMLKGNPPTMTLPVRSKSNIGFEKKLGVYKYGKKRSTRDATSLGSAKNLLRALHVVEFIEEMIEAGKSSRNVFFFNTQRKRIIFALIVFLLSFVYFYNN